jgi:phage host-nuclease inhibitor protein Gam
MTESRALYEVEEKLPDSEDPFCIDSAEKADWYLSKLAALDGEERLVDQQRDAKVAQIATDKKAWEARFAAEFEHWARAEIAKGKRKSIVLPHGTASVRNVPMSIRVTDTEAAIAWAEENAQNLVETRKVLDGRLFNSLAKTLLQETGEPLPGIEISPEREAFGVKFGKE